jgi:hypothetical protein
MIFHQNSRFGVLLGRGLGVAQGQAKDAFSQMARLITTPRTGAALVPRRRASSGRLAQAASPSFLLEA